MRSSCLRLKFDQIAPCSGHETNKEMEVKTKTKNYIAVVVGAYKKRERGESGDDETR